MKNIAIALIMMSSMCANSSTNVETAKWLVPCSVLSNNASMDNAGYMSKKFQEVYKASSKKEKDKIMKISFDFAVSIIQATAGMSETAKKGVYYMAYDSMKCERNLKGL